MNPWLRLFAEAFNFIVLLAGRPRLALYFIIIVIGIGGVGIWIPLFQWKNGGSIGQLDVYRNFATYVIAIAVTAFAEFLLRNKEDLTLTMFALGLALAGAVPGVIILVNDSLSVSALCFKVSIVATLWLWFIALADSPSFAEKASGDASELGGDIKI